MIGGNYFGQAYFGGAVKGRKIVQISMSTDLVLTSMMDVEFHYLHGGIFPGVITQAVYSARVLKAKV